jgi:hypothetical protein
VVEKTHVSVGAGAGDSAPTAPHATPRADTSAKLNGPERFWKSRYWRLVYLAALAFSIAVHYAAVPWSLLPEQSLEFHDVDGTLTIPVEILNEAPPPPPPPPEPASKPSDPEGPEGIGGKHRDAGADAARHDAALVDASETDAGGDALSDAGAGADGEPSVLDRVASPPGDSGVALVEDASAPSGNARNAVGMIGAAGNVQAGPQNIVLTVSMAVIRTHPVGKRIGPLIAVVPQWDTFLEGTGVDPLRDVDWISINGPALRHTEKDVILVRYSASDAVVDKAIGVLSKKSGQGGPVNVGVPGVKATRGYADRAERVFLRPQSHVLAVVPGYYAKTAAQILSKASIPSTLKRPAEAMRLTLVHPHGPMPQIPESVTELRLWVVPRNEDGGADVYGEGDTADAAACEAATDAIARLIDSVNTGFVPLLTRGILNHVEARADGSTVRLHLSASKAQIEVVLSFVAGQLGTTLAPDPAASDNLQGAPRPPPR